MPDDQLQIDTEALEHGTLDGLALVRAAFDAEGDAEPEQGDIVAAPPAQTVEDDEPPQPEALPPAYGEAISVLGHIDAVLRDQAAFAAVPEELRPLVANATSEMARWGQTIAREAEQRGMQLGERMAVLNELYTEDREAFEAEVERDRAIGGQFFEWKAAITRQAGVNTPETEALASEAAVVLSELDNVPDARMRVISEANRLGLRTTPADLRRLTRLVDREILRSEGASQAPPPRRVDPAEGLSPAQARAANARRLQQLPKPDVGSEGERTRSLIAGYDPNKPGEGSRLLAAALKD